MAVLKSDAAETRAGRGRAYADIVDAIGHTPLVEIARMSPLPDVRLYAKLEMANPTGAPSTATVKSGAGLLTNGFGFINYLGGSTFQPSRQGTLETDQHLFGLRRRRHRHQES